MTEKMEHLLNELIDRHLDGKKTDRVFNKILSIYRHYGFVTINDGELVNFESGNFISIIPDSVRIVKSKSVKVSGADILIFPHSVEYVEECAFVDSKNIRRIIFLNPNTSFDSRALQDVYPEELYLPNNMAVVPKYMFGSNDNKTDPADYFFSRSLGFRLGLGLKKIYLPKNLKKIENNAFYGVNGTMLLGGNENMEIEPEAFKKAGEVINRKFDRNKYLVYRTVLYYFFGKEIPPYIERIAPGTIKEGLSEIVIPPNVRQIDSDAIPFCPVKLVIQSESVKFGKNSIRLDNGLEEIDTKCPIPEEAFDFDDNLGSVTTSSHEMLPACMWPNILGSVMDGHEAFILENKKCFKEELDKKPKLLADYIKQHEDKFFFFVENGMFSPICIEILLEHYQTTENIEKVAVLLGEMRRMGL